MMGLSDSTLARLTAMNLTVGFHGHRRRWAIFICHGERRRSVLSFHRDRMALQEAVLRLTRP